MRRHALGLGLTLAALCVVASWSPPADARVIDRIVAVVNDEVITWSDLEDLMAPVMRQIDEIRDPVLRQQQRDKQLRIGLEEIIGQRLVGQEAARRRIKVAPDEVTAQIDNVKARQGWDEDALRMYLKSQGLSAGEFRRQVREQLLRQRVVRAVIGSRVRISDGDLEEFYKEKLTRANAEYELDAAHIVLALPEEATPVEEAAVRQLANEILSRAQSGERFEDLARQYSTGPGAATGGTLGTVRRGDLDPALEEALFALEEGGVGGPVRTRFGYHVVRTHKKNRLPPPPFEESKVELRRELMEKKHGEELTRWIDELKKKAFIEVRL